MAVTTTKDVLESKINHLRSKYDRATMKLIEEVRAGEVNQTLNCIELCFRIDHRIKKPAGSWLVVLVGPPFNYQPLANMSREFQNDPRFRREFLQGTVGNQLVIRSRHVPQTITSMDQLLKLAQESKARLVMLGNDPSKNLNLIFQDHATRPSLMTRVLSCFI